MHMSDALLSPAVGGAMWAVSGAAVAVSAGKIGKDTGSRRIPLMGVLAAFVFAGQMINFTIPGTGSSGHLGGGIILAVLLGPHAALLAMSSILTVQALFFADGGLLALGCNILNIGFFPAFVAYPLVFKPLAGERPSPGRLMAASLAAALCGLLLGAVSVVLQTVFSGIADLPFRPFATVMLPIHFAIGIFEGLITAAVVTFVWKERPEILECRNGQGSFSLTRIAVAFAAAAIVIGGCLSWLASSLPDGLEWSIARVAGENRPPRPEGGVHSTLGALQEKTALMPDYDFPAATEPQGNGNEEERQSAASPGTAVSGIVGSILALMLATAAGYLVRRRGDGEVPERGR